MKRLTLLVLAVFFSACTDTDAPRAPPPSSQMPERTRKQKIELGRQHKTAAALYAALREEAKGGQPLTPGTSFAFDPETPQGGLPTAKLTPEFQEKMMKRREDLNRGIEWDPISRT